MKILKLLLLYTLLTCLIHFAVGGKGELYRSKNGCCICRKKSQTGRPCRTSVLLEMCFISRTGLGIFVILVDICCRCVSIVRRWRTRQNSSSGNNYTEVSTKLNIFFLLAVVFIFTELFYR